MLNVFAMFKFSDDMFEFSTKNKINSVFFFSKDGLKILNP